MKSEIHQDFPEVQGKTVEMVEVIAESDYYGISVRFQDNTVLTFNLDACVASVTPVYSQWTAGDETIIKQHKPVRRETT